MSRLLRYKDSIQRFIKDKCCINDDPEIKATQVFPFIYGKVKESDLIFPIILLTVMNSQNKRNHVTMQGYYAASMVEFLNVYLANRENKVTITNQYGADVYHKMNDVLTISGNKSLVQNLESLKHAFSSDPDNVIKIVIQSMNVYNDSLKTIKLNDAPNIVIGEKKETDIIKWYLKDENNELSKSFQTIIPITQESLLGYIQKRYNILSELAFILGYILGGGDTGDINKLKKMAKNFSVIYKIGIDFESIDNDIKDSSDNQIPCINYIINNGIQDSYEHFMGCKQKFIEDAMTLDIYTSTMKEIIDMVEEKVDTVIDQTSPDLKSNF